MLTRLLSALFLCVIARGASAEIFDPFAVPFKQTDLQFPNAAQPYGREHEDMLFKPDGAGPFPGLVMMPPCGGVTYSHAIYDWAKRALDHGYAVMVADPLWQRKVEDNCDDPIPIPMSRMLKDAFDAGAALRKQPFVDPMRVGYVAFSQNAFTALALSGMPYSRYLGSPPFAAVVAFYPRCEQRNHRTKERAEAVDIRFIAEAPEVPLLVLLGSKDTITPLKDGNCEKMLDDRKGRGAAIDYKIYVANHIWDWPELKTLNWPDLAYDPEVTEQSAKDAFAFLAKELKAQKSGD
jgi:dienelactone hydrolase